MHATMKKAQNGCDERNKEDDFGLFMLHSKVSRGSSPDGTWCLKAHMMAVPFCSKFKDDS